MNYLIRVADINISIHSINDIDNKNIKEYIAFLAKNGVKLAIV